MKDLFGKAILDFQTNNNPENIITETSISSADEMSVDYLFRSYLQMPKIEQKALELCFGRILDVGCGAGSHSLYLQNNKNLDVLPIDISANAIEACKLRGLNNTANINVLDLENQKFDSILLLMNGTGIFETLENVSKYLQKLKSLLNKDGQILIDSTDLIFMYDDDEKDFLKNSSEIYYGQIMFSISYKNEIEEPFPWLYLDFETLQNLANKNKLQCQMILEGENYNYLARLFV